MDNTETLTLVDGLLREMRQYIEGVEKEDDHTFGVNKIRQDLIALAQEARAKQQKVITDVLSLHLLPIDLQPLESPVKVKWQLTVCLDAVLEDE